MNQKNAHFLAVLSAFITGALFSVGLFISGMAKPEVVQSFLNITGLLGLSDSPWDARLLFVMLGALSVSIFVFGIVLAQQHNANFRPWFAVRFELPTRKDIDARLLMGAALFGIGWGLAGYCPGPALASLLVNGFDAIFFVFAMLIGMAVAKRF